MNNKNEIIAGAGIIENDFHDRKDLSPNLCALFVEEKYRKQGIAKYILNFLRKDLGSMGFEKIYLITDHTGFYEKYDWSFLTTVNDDEGNYKNVCGFYIIMNSNLYGTLINMTANFYYN